MQDRAPRFEIQKPLEFRVMAAGAEIRGQGRTVNISRRGILFETDEPLQVGSKIELVVDMGTGPDSHAPIELRAQGVTVRKQEGAVAVEVRKQRLVPGEAQSGG